MPRPRRPRQTHRRLKRRLAADETDASASDVTDAAAEGAAVEDAAASSEVAELESGAVAQDAPAPKRKREGARRRPPASKVLTPAERQAEREEERRKKAIARRTGRAAARAKYRAAAHERTATPPREHDTGSAEDPSGHRRLRQGRQDDHRADRRRPAPPQATRRSSAPRTPCTRMTRRNDAHIGDTVVVREARPLSRTKRWRLVEVVERAR